MAVIKLTNVGDSATCHIVKCEVVEGKFGEDVKFTTANGDTLFINRKSADRQLARLGFADEEMVLYSDVDGTTLRFYRSENTKQPGKHYWNIDRIIPEDDARNRPSLVEAAKQEAERVRVAKGLPKEELSNTMGSLPYDDAPPPPTDEDYPYADDDGMPPVKAPPKTSTLTAEQANKEGAINAAYARAYAFTMGVQGPVATPDSLQAGAATLLIAYRQSGIC